MKDATERKRQKQALLLTGKEESKRFRGTGGTMLPEGSVVVRVL